MFVSCYDLRFFLSCDLRLVFATQDMLRYEGYNAYFDCDNLSTISKEKLAEGIAKSCCVVCILPVSCHDLHSFVLIATRPQ